MYVCMYIHVSMYVCMQHYGDQKQNNSYIVGA